MRIASSEKSREADWRVTELEQPTRMRHVGDDGSSTVDLVVEIRATDGGCRVSPTMEVTPRWYMAPVMAVAWPLFMRQRAEAALGETLDNAKRILEGETGEDAQKS